MKDSIGIVTNDKRPYEPVPKPTERFFQNFSEPKTTGWEACATKG